MYIYMYIYIYTYTFFLGSQATTTVRTHQSSCLTLRLHAARAATSTCLRKVSRAISMKLSRVTWFLDLTSALLTS